MKLYREHKAAKEEKKKAVKDTLLLPQGSQSFPVIIYEESGFLSFLKKLISFIALTVLMLAIGSGISLLLIYLFYFIK